MQATSRAELAFDSRCYRRSESDFRSRCRGSTRIHARTGPGKGIGLLDLEGFRSFAGHGLELLNSPRQAESNVQAPKAGAPQLFSDLNQWMLKVLLAPRIPKEYLSGPRGQYQGPSQLAQAAGVSAMSAFRFVEQFSKAGFIDSGPGPLPWYAFEN